MFCSKCGKNLPDDTKFCDGCGTPTGLAVQAAQPSPTVQAFLKTLKGYFSKNSTATIADTATSSGLEWLFFAGINLIVYMFAFAVNVVELHDSFEFGKSLLYGLLISVVTYFGTSGVLFLGVKLGGNNAVRFQNVLNLVAAATLPLTLIYVANMLLGLIWFPFVLVASIAGLSITMLLIYNGMQKLVQPGKTPLWPCVAAWTVITTVITLIYVIVAETEAVEGILQLAAYALFE